MGANWSGAIFVLFLLHTLVAVGVVAVGVSVMNAKDIFRSAAKRFGGQLGQEKLQQCDTGVDVARSLAMAVGAIVFISAIIVYCGMQALAEAATEQYVSISVWMLGSFLMLTGWTVVAWLWRRKNAALLKELKALQHTKRVLYHRGGV